MTAQFHETLIIDGNETSMAFCPRLPFGHPRIVALDADDIDHLHQKAAIVSLKRDCPELASRMPGSDIVIGPEEQKELLALDGVFSTGCWRRYIGTWEIKDGRFYLVGLRGIYRLDGEPIFADWFTGALRIPKGEMLQYVHMGFGSVYEQELHIRITKGIVVRTRLIDNRGKTFDKWELGPQNLPGGENHFAFDTEGRFFASLVVRCPSCLTQSDVPDPDNVFDLVGLRLAPDSDYLLWECKCGGCKRIFEGAARNSIPIDQTDVDSFDQQLLERYTNAIDKFASMPGEDKTIDGRPVEFKGSIDVEAEVLNFEENEDFRKKQIIIPIEALALARGIRKTAVNSPGRAFACTVGPLGLIIRLDLEVNKYNLNFPQAMHLRITDHVTGAPVTGAKLNFGISLVFAYEGFQAWPWFHGERFTQCGTNDDWAEVHVPWRI